MDTTTPSPDPSEEPRFGASSSDDPAGGDDALPAPRRRRLATIAGLAVVIPAIGLVSYGVSNAAGADDTAAVVEDELAECAEWAPTPEDIAALNAEADALGAFFDQRGIRYTVETDDDGIRFVVWDENDETASQAYDEWAESYYPADEEADADMQADEDALAAHLDQRGIRYTWETEDGFRYVVVNENDEAANRAVEEFWAERYPLSADEVAALTADEDALAAYLDEQGIAYTRETDAYGVSYVVVDENDEAATQAVEDFYAERTPGGGSECVVVAMEETEVIEAEGALAEVGD